MNAKCERCSQVCTPSKHTPTCRQFLLRETALAILGGDVLHINLADARCRGPFVEVTDELLERARLALCLTSDLDIWSAYRTL